MKTLGRICIFMMAVVFGAGAQEAVHQVLHNFSGPPDGALPNGSPVLDGATLYGTATQAGSNGGVVFSISTNGLDYTILHSFTSTGTLTYNGRFPESTLLLTNGTLIGTTFYGGTNDAGVVFQLNTNGANFQVLHTLGGPRAAIPWARSPMAVPRCTA